MVLCQVMKFYKTFLCDACWVWTNGFYYNCETCSKDLCNGSGFSFSTSGFKCDDCKFKISHNSALLPVIAINRFIFSALKTTIQTSSMEVPLKLIVIHTLWHLYERQGRGSRIAVVVILMLELSLFILILILSVPYSNVESVIIHCA
ncbi:unnamed protein product [Ilex paraguariensis]|uniref:Uncharacterized protein n=1 Tax=Ilex paraguariensis TaxID=185542 RepID=A0ABC8REW0_9AQUA